MIPLEGPQIAHMPLEKATGMRQAAKRDCPSDLLGSTNLCKKRMPARRVESIRQAGVSSMQFKNERVGGKIMSNDVFR